MLLYGVPGSPLADRAIAVSLAGMLVERRFGADELKRQKPFAIKDQGDAWLIRSNPQAANRPPDQDGVTRERVEIVIRKSNCEVLQFTMHASLRPPRS